MKIFFLKNRIAVVLVAYCGLLFGVIYFAILPLLAHINSTNEQIQQELANRQGKEQRIAELPKIKQQYTDIEENKELISGLLDKNQAVTLIERLEKLANDTGNKIVISVKDAPIVDTKKIPQSAKDKDAKENPLRESLPSSNYLQMQITINGSYNNGINFIEALESFEYYADISGIQIKQAKASSTQRDNSLLNPFSSSSASSGQKIKIDKAGDLDFILDVFFYTNK